MIISPVLPESVSSPQMKIPWKFMPVNNSDKHSDDSGGGADDEVDKHF